MKTIITISLWYILITLMLVLPSCRNDEIALNSQPSVQMAVNTKAVSFGSLEVGQSLDQPIVITNSFSFIQKLTVTLRVSSSPFSLVGGNSTFTLEPGESRTVFVRFTPTSSGTYSGSIMITHNALNVLSPITIQLSGTGTRAAGADTMSVNPTQLDFGTVAVNQSSIQTVTITNQSSSTTNGTITISGGVFTIVSGGGSYTLPAAQSRVVTIRFSPTASGSYAGVLTIERTGSSAITVPLSGNGGTSSATDIQIDVDPISLDFGRVVAGQAQQQSIRITNLSGSTGILTGAVAIDWGVSGFSIINGSGSLRLNPGESRSVVVRFAPTTGGVYTGSIRILHNATNTSSPIQVSLRGESIRSIVMSVAPTSLTFPVTPVGRSAVQTVTIANSTTSTNALSFTLGIDGIGFSITNGLGSYSLSPGQSTIVTVKFSPSSSASYSGALRISHNATSTANPVVVSLSGTGQTGSSTISMLTSTTLLDFGSVRVGQSKDSTLTITNSSSSTDVLTGNVMLDPTGAGFIIIDGAGSFTLSPGQSRSVTIRFKPIMTGSHAQGIQITHNAGNLPRPYRIALHGNGQ